MSSYDIERNSIIGKSCDIKFIFRSSKLSTKESYFVSRIKRIISFHDIWNNFLNRLIGSPVKRRRLVLHSFCTASAVHCKHIHIKTISRLPFLTITLLLQDTIKAPLCTVFLQEEVLFHFVILSFLISREMCELTKQFRCFCSHRFVLSFEFICLQIYHMKYYG